MPRKVTIPIYDGDDFERLGVLDRRVRAAEDRARKEPVPAVRFGDGPDPEYVTTARAELEAFITEAADRAEAWTLETIGHGEFRALLREHPARKEGDVVHEDDVAFGVNVETFPAALLEFVDPEDDEIRTVTSPQFDTTAALKRRLKRMSAGEYDTLWIAAFHLNDGTIRDPKADLPSSIDPRFAEI